ncbi:heparinase II/III-family protein [Alicyclobacillus fastidiosus]|uniref:Heparinase II/III-family protein n=1 Tax=Alicyclobacillus fastidiosus TaxID=392011 RepID=A0ABY6ZE21_9BACL|nr:heparinase II/III family protein [Alicyclobacillus fastidiosus]WAH41053.1 heparinase II/III-family protein [Alicyclobacillus fastidiosus]GMA62584.1 heparinase [Alicyclobacillus fastidiosus]
MLTERFVDELLGDFLFSRETYHPFPTIEDRDAWDSLPSVLKKFWKDRGERKLNHSWTTITATQYMDYSRTGNRTRYDNVFWERRQDLASLVVAECIENQGRFLDDIVNGIWCICEETFWGIPGHGYMMKRHDSLPDVSDPIIELFSAETAALLAWTSYLLKSKLDSISIMVCERILFEVDRRILTPYLNRTDFWWMGFNQERMLNNWNPWCNSNCLAAFLLLEDDPQRREAAVVKTMRSLDNYIDRLHSDGGCEEGPKYWTFAGGALFDCLELLYGVSGGKIDVYNEPLIQQIGRYLYKAFIDDCFYVNFADSSPKVDIPAELVYRYGIRIGDSKLSGLGAMALKKKRERSTVLDFANMFRMLPALFNYSKVEDHVGDNPLVRDAWLDGIQVIVAREQHGSSKGLYLAAKGGHNDESHNHNDIGQFIVYCDGSPMVIDPGVMTYTAKSFFSERYTIWATQSAYHNLPIVNGVQQLNGRQYQAYEVRYHQEDTIASITMNIAGAYPDSAGIKSWIRSASFIRDSHPCIEIKDNFQLKRVTDDITLILMTPYSPQSEGNGSIVLQDDHYHTVRIQYNGEMLEVSSEKIPIEDEAMREIWGDQIYRIKLKTIKAIDHGECVLKISQFP